VGGHWLRAGRRRGLISSPCRINNFHFSMLSGPDMAIVQPFPVRTGGYFNFGEAAGTWSCSLSSNYQYILSPTRLHRVVSSYTQGELLHFSRSDSLEGIANYLQRLEDSLLLCKQEFYTRANKTHPSYLAPVLNTISTLTLYFCNIHLSVIVPLAASAILDLIIELRVHFTC
jgi:hypothetical protein